MRFEETQRMTQWWLWGLVLILALSVWGLMIRAVVLRQPLDSEEPLWATAIPFVLVGIGLPVLMFATRMTTQVSDEAVIIRYRPFTTVTIPHTDIERFEARHYNPILEYGGWGLRGWGSKRAYNVSGSQGVELFLTDGRRIMVGSQRPDELAAALQQ